MKTYYNPTTDEWYYEGHSMTRRIDEHTVFSGYPTVEQLTSWGFEEYVPPTPPAPDPVEEARNYKLAQLEEYDNSDNVNSFTLNGVDMWIRPDERSNYMITLQGAKRLGIENITFLGHSIPVDTAMSILDAVNVYAMMCVGVTESHRADLNSFTTVEQIETYDVTTGYPEKLVFTV